MTLFVFPIWICVTAFIQMVTTQNTTHCSSPNVCEYNYDANNPVSCVCSNQCQSGGIRKLCFYNSQLKQNCAPTCTPSKSESACGNLCCYRDCLPNPWQEWSICNGPCGNVTGTRKRIRTVNPDETPQCGGKECPPLNDIESCRTGCCKVDCKWSEWSQWSECNTTCGNGYSKRNRTNFPKASCGGFLCDGSSEELKSCTQFVNTNCVMDSWTSWSACMLTNQVCGSGMSFRTRSVITQGNCKGIPCDKLQEAKTCQGPCCTQDCVVSDWTEWSFCSVSCGNGSQTRTRTIVTPDNCGGVQCPLNYIENRPCDKQTRRNCTISQWSPWSPCSSSCGTGFKTSTRQVIIDEACGGICNESLVRTQTCESYSGNKNCMLDVWSDWSQCMPNCEGGIKFRSRKVFQYPQCKGVPCPELQENSTCLKPCSQLCNAGVCSCKPGFELLDDNLSCAPTYCIALPNALYDPPNLLLSVDYLYVNISCKSTKLAVGENCTVGCLNKNFVLRGDVANFTCQTNGNFNYQKMYCSLPNRAPTDIRIDRTTVADKTSPDRCFATLETLDPDGKADKFVYTLKNNFENRLRIRGNLLCLNYTPEYSAPNNTWLVLIRTTDIGLLFFEKWVNVSITRANDPPSSCKFDRDNKIPENVGQPLIVGYLVCKDSESNVGLLYPSMIYSDKDSFEIFFDPNQPTYKYGIKVRTVASAECKERGGTFCTLNYEMATQYRIDIIVVDYGTPIVSKYYELFVQLIDMNDAPTAVTLNNTDVYENMKPGDRIGTFGIEDEDNKTQSYEYRIVKGAVDYFDIEKNLYLTLKKSINNEDPSMSSFEIFVMGSDNGIPSKNVTTRFLLKRKDVNKPPEIYMVSDSELKGDIYYIRRKESNTIGDKISTIYARVQGINNTISYIISGATNSITISDKGCKPEDLQKKTSNCQFDLLSGVSFDYKVVKQLSFNITSTDQKNLTKTNQFILIIESLNDTPENITFLATNSTTIEIEEERQGIVISQLVASTNYNHSFNEFKIIGDIGGCFEIVNGSILKLKDKKSLDYEGLTRTNIVLVEVFNKGTPPKSSKGNLTINAKDVNERPTDIILINNTIFENATDSTIVSIIKALDPDFNDSFTFSLTSSTNSVFRISGNALKVIHNNESKLNFEAKREELITIEVSDKGKLTYSKVFRILVLDANDAPYKLGITNNIVPELSPIGTIIGLFTCTEEDANQTVTYKLANKTAEFAVTAKGELVTNAILNYETNNQYEVPVVYYDNGSPSLTSIGVVKIFISDVNDPPFFEPSSPSTISFQENAPKPVHVITALDPDLNEKLNFRCISHKPVGSECPITLDNVRCINTSTPYRTKCTVEINPKTTFNYNYSSEYDIELRVSDNLGLTANLTVKVLIKRADQLASIIVLNGEPLSSVKIPENKKGVVIGKLSFANSDFNKNYTFTISGTNSSDGKPFLQIKDQIIQCLSDFSFNFEEQSCYNVTIQATNNVQPSLIINVWFLIYVVDINESPLMITLSTYEVKENLPKGSIVANISASDPDNLREIRQVLTFAILNHEVDAFEIFGSQIKVNNSARLNYEMTKNITIILQGTDNGIPPLSCIQPITLQILNANDPPSIINLNEVFLQKNAPANTIVRNITVQDEDKDQTHTLSLLKVEPENYSSFFSINDKAQLVKRSQEPIFVPIINITITVTDNGTPPMSDTRTSSIIIVEKNIQSESELVLNSEFSVDKRVLENATIGSHIGHLKINLANTSIYQGFQVANEEAKEYFLFKDMACINQNQLNLCTLQIYLNRPLDYETKQSIKISVLIILQGGPNITLVHVMNIGDVNERPSDILSFPNELSIIEKAPPQTSIGFFRGVDQDANERETFEMSSKIDGVQLLENGTLLTNGNGFDYKLNTSVVLLIRVSDKGKLTLQKSFTLKILKKLEPPKIVDLKPMTILGNITADQVAYVFNVTGPDSNKTYLIDIVENYKNNFQIDGNKLKVIINKTMCSEKGLACGLNYEPGNRNISITVRVKDLSSPPESNYYNILVQIENPKNMAKDIKINASVIEENMPVNSRVGSLTIVNEDAANIYRCSVVSNSPFYIDSSLTLRTNTSLDFERGSRSHRVNISCTNQNNYSIYKELTISVKDVNEAPYKISTDEVKDQLNFTSNKNQSRGSFIGFVYCKDPDQNELLNIKCDSFFVTCQKTQCSIDNSTNGTICKSEVMVTSSSFFNEERSLELSFNVSVSDKEQITKTELIVIKLIPTKEKTPLNEILFRNSTDKNIEFEKSSTSRFMGNFSQLNEDKSYPSYFRILSNNSEWFQIRQNSELWNNPPDTIKYTTQTEYVLQIGLFKNGSLLIDKIYVVRMKNVNRSPTGLFLSPTKVPENLPSDSVVGVLSVDYPDSSISNQTFAFQLLTHNTTFYIANQYVKLMKDQRLNFENISSYNLSISVTNSGSPQVTTKFTIILNIEDVNEPPTNPKLSNNKINENAPIGTVIGFLSAEDVDQNSKFVFTVNDTNFIVSNNTLMAATVFDYELRNIYYILITVFDNGRPMLNVTAIFQILIINQNEKFTLTLTNVQGNVTDVLYVSENNNPGIIIGFIGVRDPNLNSNIFLTIRPENTSFKIQKSEQSSNYSKYQLSLERTVDFEKEPQLDLNVEAKDKRNLTQNININVKILNVNEPPTKIELADKTTNSINIKENFKGPQLVASFITTDPDKNDIFQYFIDACDNCKDKFEFPKNESKLYLKESQYFNYEDLVGKDVKIHVRSVDSGGLSIKIAVPVNISDENDAPVVHGLSFTQIPKYVTENSKLGTVNVTDEDLSPENRNLTCLTINSLNWISIQKINNAQLVIAKESKYIANTSITFDIQCSDNGQPPLSSTKTNIPVYVVDMGNEPGELEFKWVVGSVTENQANITLGELYLRTKYSNKTLEIKSANISSTWPSKVNISLIDKKTITLISPLDYETMPSLQISFTLFENGVYQKITKTIVVNDINEPPTEIKTSPSILQIPEKCPKDFRIASLSAVDQDRNQTFSWKIIEVSLSKDNNSIPIKTNYSVVKLNNEHLMTDVDSANVLKRNNVFAILVRIACFDSGQPSLSIEALLKIIVINVNGPPSIVDLKTIRDPIPENTTINTILATFKVKDEDLGDNHTCTCNNSFFSASTNSIILIKKLDFETAPKMETELTCYDNERLSATVLWRISISDINEPPDRIIQKENLWMETEKINTLMSQVTAIDPEKSKCHYVLQNCTNMICPFILLSNGSIFLNQSLTSITNTNEIRFNVAAFDESNNSQTFPLAITIIRQNLTRISIAILHAIAIPENALPGLKVFEIEIKFAAEVNPLIYCEVDTIGDLLYIQQWKVFLNKSVDYERNKTMPVNVICFQSRAQRVNTTSITLNITDVDEPLKEIKTNITKSVTEGNHTNEYIGNVFVKDPDFNSSAVKCVASKPYLSFKPNNGCKLMNENGRCELSFDVFLSGYVEYSNTQKELNISIECRDAISSVAKTIILEIKNVNNPPENLIVNGSRIIDLDTMKNGYIGPSLIVVEKDPSQSHNIAVQPPGDKYFVVNKDHKLVLQNLEYAWTGDLNCTFRVTDNGLPPLTSIFIITFRFIKSNGEILLSNSTIPITLKANSLIGEIKLNSSKTFNNVSYKLNGVPDNAFKINNTGLWLTKDADQLPNSKIIINITAINNLNNAQIANTIIQLEIVGRSVCQSNLNNCHANATCRSVIGSNQFNCSCNPGFGGNGRNCTDINDCLPNPCLGNDSSCIDLLNGFQCQCGSKRSGNKCEILKNTNCDGIVCQNGICNGNNTCLCTAGWQGRNCNESFNFCTGELCSNHGRCVNQLDGFYCACDKNFTGDSCEYNTEICGKCSNQESCLTMVDKTIRCVNNNKILTIKFQIPDSQIAKYPNYQNDLLKFLQNIPNIQNYTTYFKVDKLNPKRYQLEFTAIDPSGNALSGSQSLGILTGFCGNKTSDSLESTTCTGLLSGKVKIGKVASSLVTYLYTSAVVCLLQLLYRYW